MLVSWKHPAWGIRPTGSVYRDQMTEVGGQMIEVGMLKSESQSMAHSGLEEGGRQIAAVRFFSLIVFPNRQSHA